MPLYKATVEILVDAASEAEACDCITETLRDHLREFSPGSALIDWRYAGVGGDPEPHDGSGFEYARISGKRAFPFAGGSDVPTE